MNAAMTREEMLALIAQMQADNATLRANQAKPRAVTLKVTDKGGVSLYGLGRFPVTLYASQWDKLLDNTATIKQFIETNRSVLTTKD